jgi:hypothetical protein
MGAVTGMDTPVTQVLTARSAHGHMLAVLQHFPYLSGLVNNLRHFIAITLLLVHLFNAGGYRLVFDHMEEAAGERMITRIDGQYYDDRDLLEIRVPVNLPYQTNSPDFERIDGEVSLNGVHYNYVKRKIFNDTLILLCVPNTEKTKVFNARETFFSLVNDLQQEQPKGQHPAPAKTMKFAQPDCIVEASMMLPPVAAAARISFATHASPDLGERFARSPEQPPDARMG